jgi:hypothetical protein
MLHKISDFCDKIDDLKNMSDRLRDMKYGTPKASKLSIDEFIATIQLDCQLLANDKSKYNKE